MVLTDTALRIALDDLVARDVITGDQAGSVLDAVARTPAVEQPPAGPHRAPLGRLLIEAAAYLGAALVAASAVAYVVQQWSDLGTAARLTLLLGMGVVGLGAGAAVVLLSGGREALTVETAAARRRLAGVLLTFGAVLTAVGVGQLAPAGPESAQGSWQWLLTGALMLAILGVAQLAARSALTDLGLFVGAWVLVVQLTAMAVPALNPDDSWDWAAGPPPARWWEYLQPLAIVALGLLWAVVVSRWLSVPVLATCVGLLAALMGAISLAGDERMRALGFAVLAALALAGAAVFVASRAWPWVALAVLATTALVFFAVVDSGGAVTAFLVSGLVLLAGSGAAAWAASRRREPVTAQTTTRTSERSGT